YHCFGMVMATLACANFGATLVLPDDSFDPLTTLKAVEKEACTALYGVPTMFSMILNHPQRQHFDVSSLRTGIVAGALCPEVLMNQIISDLNMREITNCYGMTETSPVSFQSATDDSLQVRATTVGSVHPNVELKVIDTKGNIVPRGVRGELCTKGYSVMQGYWGDPERTAKAIIDGWMHTGDEAMIDERGYGSIVGRIKVTIIRGGENIAPKEIEEFLLKNKDIIEAQAFGVSDSRYGEIVAVWLRLKEGSVLTEDQVKEYCKGQIAHFKVPEIVKFVDEFPMTVTGKAQKFLMRAETEKNLLAG
ncbi:MAG: AMP-binding protein, partial [Arenicella sp.]|nr:AMP-binding protein [Arenicella sp.]